MDAVILIVVGAALAHLSAIITGWQHHRLDHTEHRGERLRTFRIEQLLGLQAALFALEGAARQSPADGGHEPGEAAANIAAVAQVRRALVLIDDPALRNAVISLLRASPLAPEEAIDATNATIGEQIRALAAG